MTARPLAAAALLALAACPLPQPLPIVQRTDGATVTPPRIVVGSATPPTALVRVGTGCDPASVIPFTVDLEDTDVDDAVQARWFVDYDLGSTGVQRFEDVAPAPDASNPIRTLSAPFLFRVGAHASSQPHVVELVVSNGFHDIGGDPPGAAVNRTPQAGYEVQVFRWVVVYDGSAGCP